MTDLITPSNEVKVILNLLKIKFSVKAKIFWKNIIFFEICTNITDMLKKYGIF